ncbi:YkgJ family cysteine cluster protein [Fluviispira multicolorata]|uniref:Zinc-or iron-chelating domain-containing protein n=1 Tax=Fluviispira multicolorata TaxID=2654512 RepID=A0A833JCN9_9BACT|nr:YkgJ family cysteine cluster protein [Fluviispira multicolorata]KAB8030836.1 hypothetical protein GCL57_07630 [Fluviispira multicolorata]
MDYKTAITQLIPFIDNIYTEYDEASKISLKEFQIDFSNEKITCQKGCGACCHFPIIPVTAGEAFVLLNKLLATGYDLNSLAEMLFKYKDEYFKFTKKNGKLPITNSDQKLFLKENIPCPFLLKKDSSIHSGSCGIFDFRPLICDFYNSIDSPKLCELKLEHRSIESIASNGSVAQDKIREFERNLFGRSSIGHLPLLLASFCTQNGLNSFLTIKKLTADELSEEYAQELNDFSLYHELLSSIDYILTEKDILAIEEAQSDLMKRLACPT